MVTIQSIVLTDGQSTAILDDMIQTPPLSPRPATALPITPTQADAWLAWRAEAPEQAILLSVAELAECQCPELCNRDHPNE